MHLKAAHCRLSYLLDHTNVLLANLGIPLRELSEALLFKVILWVGAIVRFVIDHLVKRSDHALDGLEWKIYEIDFLMLVHVLLVLEQLRLQMEVMVLEVIGKVAEVFIAQIRIYPTLDLGK